MRRVSIIILLVLLTVANSVRPLAAGAAPSCELSSDETASVQAAVQRLVNAEMVSGYPSVIDQSLSLYSRAQFAALLVKGLGLRHEAEQSGHTSSFTDLQDHWAAGYAEVLYRQRILTGYPGGAFRPDDKITLAQVKLMLARALRLGSDLSLETADAALRRSGVGTSVPCSHEERAQAGQIYLLIDRALSAHSLARIPEWAIPRTGPAETGWAPSIADIDWVQVRFGLPVDEVPFPLYRDRPADVPVLSRITQWLQAAQPVEGEATFGRGPYLQVRLQDGRSMSVFLAFDCVTEKTSTGVSVTCRHAEGEVLVYGPASDSVRLRAPELAAWLLGGYNADLWTSPKLEVTPLPGDLFRVQGNGWPGAETMNIWLPGEYPYSCCPPSNGTHLAAVPVVRGQFVWTGKIPGSGKAELLVVADTGGATGIWVER